MSAIQNFIEEYLALKEKCRVQEAEIAVLKGWHKFGVQPSASQEVSVYGRSLAQLARDVDRLRRIDLAAKESE